jgi:hypothetical protein
LLKTQNDVIAYLQVELERRRDWEDRMSKEMHQRHAVLLTLVTNLMPVPANKDDAPNPNGGFMNPSSLATASTPRPGDILVRTLQNVSQGSNGTAPATGAHQDAANKQLRTPVTLPTDAIASHIAGTSLSHLSGRLGTNGISVGADINKSTRSMLPDQAGQPFGPFNTYDPTGKHAKGSTSSQADGPLINGNFNNTNEGDAAAVAARPQQKGATSVRSSKRKRREGTASSDEGRGGVEVDERGVIYMASGKKTDSRPAKIQVSSNRRLGY